MIWLVARETLLVRSSIVDHKEFKYDMIGCELRVSGLRRRLITAISICMLLRVRFLTMFDVEYPDDSDVLLLRERVLIKVDSKQLDGLDAVKRVSKKEKANEVLPR